MQLVKDVRERPEASPEIRALVALAPFERFAGLAGALFASLTGNAGIGRAMTSVHASDGPLVEITPHDSTETTRRHCEPGASPAPLLFARRCAVLAHRVAQRPRIRGDANLARALKTTCGRAFGRYIHPAPWIGGGSWLDHGPAFVVGETSVIEEGASVWQNATLGSTPDDGGPSRHPLVGRGAIIGAEAMLPGGITVRVEANVRAGAIVARDVPAGDLRFARHVHEHLNKREGGALTARHAADSEADARRAAACGLHVVGHLEFGRDVALWNGTQGCRERALPSCRTGTPRIRLSSCASQHGLELIHVPREGAAGKGRRSGAGTSRPWRLIRDGST